VLRACKVAEDAGVPAFAIITEGFLRQAKATAGPLGVPDVWIAPYPGVMTMDSPEETRDKVHEVLIPSLVEGMTARVGAGGGGGAAPAEAEPGPLEPVVVGTIDEVNEYFHARGWTDGLPIIPPTRSRVADFLSWTERDPDEVLGVLPNAFREATIRSIAVNGVMAGCRPEYMPLLVSIVEVMADPRWKIEDAGCTPGPEQLVVVSGRVVEDLAFNSGVGAMRVGNQANTSIGRFVRMYIRNIAGFRPEAGTDLGSIGSTFNVALAENEAAVNEIGWAPFRVDKGFSEADSTVTVQSVVSISGPCYSGGTTPEKLMEPLVYYLSTTSGPWAFTGVWHDKWEPLIVMGPTVARAFAAFGWTKADIRHYLYEHCTIEAKWLEEYPLHAAATTKTFPELLELGLIDERFVRSDDPQRPIPVLLDPDAVDIVVAGDPMRGQSRIYCENHNILPPITRAIQLPVDWSERLKRRT
jgi:hypothetical protein